MILDVYIDADTERYLKAASLEHGRCLEWLAAAAVSEAALSYARGNHLLDAERNGRASATSGENISTEIISPD